MQPEFKAKITPEHVKKKLDKKSKADLSSGPQKPKEPDGPTEKSKAPETPEKKKQKAAEFLVDARINDYGFLGFKAGWLSALGWQKGMAIKIERNADGSITIRKA